MSAWRAMHRLLILVLGASAVSATTTAAVGFEAVVQAADAAWADRGDPSRLSLAIAGYGEAAALRPDDPGPLVKLARAQAFRARAAPRQAREAWRETGRAAEAALRRLAPGFEQSVTRGEPTPRAAARVGPPGAEALYLLGMAGMGMAQERGMAAVLAVKEGALALIERAAVLDERVDRAGPRRALGAWLATVPTAAGGGPAASRRELDRARQLFPDELLTDVEEAGTLAVLVQDRDRFDTLLRRVLGSDATTSSPDAPTAPTPRVAAPPADRKPEAELARRLARELLTRRDRLF